MEKGNALYGLSRYEEAITTYDKALEITPEYAYLTYYGKANALSVMGNYTAAISFCDKVLSLEPRYPGPWTMKGNALAALGDTQGAMVAYDKALSLDPNYQLAVKGKIGGGKYFRDSNSHDDNAEGGRNTHHYEYSTLNFTLHYCDHENSASNPANHRRNYRCCIPRVEKKNLKLILSISL